MSAPAPATAGKRRQTWMPCIAAAARSTRHRPALWWSTVRLLSVIALAATSLASACNPDACDSSAGSHCEGDVLWDCRADRDGFAVDYRWAQSDCTESDQVCAEASPTQAFCAESRDPDPVCADVMPSGNACDGDDVVYCLLGYVTIRTPCDSCADGACPG